MKKMEDKNEEGRQEHGERAQDKERAKDHAHKGREVLGQASKQGSSAKLMESLRVKSHNKEVKIEE